MWPQNRQRGRQFLQRSDPLDVNNVLQERFRRRSLLDTVPRKCLILLGCFGRLLWRKGLTARSCPIPLRDFVTCWPACVRNPVTHDQRVTHQCTTGIVCRECALWSPLPKSFVAECWTSEKATWTPALLSSCPIPPYDSHRPE